MRPPQEELLYRARPNLRIGGVDWPLFAHLRRDRDRHLVRRHRRPEPDDALGRAWAGSSPASLFYVVYRRRVVHEPLTATVKAPPAYGPALALEYRRLLVPVLPGRASDDALDIAAGLAAERGAQIAAVYVIEIPLDLPLRADLPDEEALANRELDEARAIGDSYGVTVIPRLVRAPQRRRRDRARGGAARRPRSSSSARRARISAAASARSSAAPSTTCSRTRPAACS